MYRQLAPGATGPDVLQLEQSLETLGFSPGTVDDVYDAGTEAALDAFYLSKGYASEGPSESERQALTDARKAELQKIHPNLTVTEGSLDDASVIEEAVLKADIVINMASSDHWPSVKGKYMAVWRRRYAYYTDVTNSYSRWVGEKLK